MFDQTIELSLTKCAFTGVTHVLVVNLYSWTSIMHSTTNALAGLNNRASFISINFVRTNSVPSIAILVRFQIAAHGTEIFDALSGIDSPRSNYSE